ncbi:MAG TPA: hypothetical protein VGS19_16695 [Streptosporangiaceae bacterium]|nr:hypothetical protein [Streptosporangiaceae bacterium]
MHRFLSRVAPFALAALALSLAFAASDAAAALRGGQGAGTPTTAQAGLGVPGTRTQPLVMVNGERVLATAAGGGLDTAIVRPPGESGLAASMLRLQAGGSTSLVPEAALPYLGHGLDPSLFNLSTLQRVERGGRLPVALSYHETLHAPPGVTVTHRGAATATGYLTASSAALFGNALARQMLADHTRASYGTDGLFADGLTLSVPGAALAPALVQHRFPMHTLTVHGTDLAGHPDTGDQVFVFDVSDPAAFTGPGSISDFYHGVAKYSVPSGTYWAVGSFYTPTQLRLDILPQFTVRGGTSITLTAAAATSELTIVTPRPAVTFGMGIDLARYNNHAGANLDWVGSGSTMWVSPVSKAPTVGMLNSATSAQLTSPAGQHGLPYTYWLTFPAPPGTVPSQHFTVGPGDLATVHDRFFSDAKTTGGWLAEGGTVSQIETIGFGGFFLPLPLPGRDVQYVSASPAMLWQTQYYTGGGVVTGGQSSAFQLYKAGESMNEVWNAYPLHPAPNVSNVSLGGPFFNTPLSAARAADNLVLDITPFSDSTFGHYGTGYTGNSGGGTGHTAGQYAIYDNGHRIAQGNAVAAARGNPALYLQVPLSAKPSQVKVVVTASHQGPGVNLSSASEDVWTWLSKPDPQATVPVPWDCGGSSVHHHVVIDRHCVVQDMLVPDYAVSGLLPDGSHGAGPQSLSLSIGHLQEAAPSRITHAQVQVSYDNGTTWQSATLTRTGPGQFTAAYTAPASSLVSLRVTARDAQGATITETIDSAYQTSA